MATQKERFLKYLQTCVKSTRATESNPLLLGGNAPKDYTRFLESDRLFDYNPGKWDHLGSMYDINDASKAQEVFNALIADEEFLTRDKNDNQGWRRGAISHYVCFLNAQEFFANNDGEQSASASVPVSLSLQQIFYGAPGTGKSHSIKDKEDQFAEVIRTTFHPDSDYSTFVGAYKPTMKRTKKCVIIDKEEREITPTITNDEYEERISYTFVKQAFLKAYIAAWKGQKEGKNILLVIEEINRGNCAQIFGDLFQLLDREESGYSSYPISADEDLRQVLEREFAEIEDMPAKVKSGEELLLPGNLYIWATMNTSDQSLFPIDSAFKRRWDWNYVPIANKEDKDYSIEVDGMLYDWWDFLSKVNTAIGKTTESEDKKLGYFFCKADKKAIPSDKENNVISADRFVSKAIFYIWNDVMKDYDPNEVTFQYKVTSEEGKNELVTLSLMSYKAKGENGEDQDVTISFSDFFQGAGDINLDTVKRLMDNLKIKTKERKEVENSGSDESATAGGFLVRFKDGTVINKKRPVETFIESIKYIAELTSYEEIAGVGITHNDYPLLSKERQNGTDPRQLGDKGEWWLMTRMKHPIKVNCLKKISDKLHLDLIITFATAPEMPERVSDTNMPFRVTFPDGEVISNGNGWDTYVAALRKIGLDKALPYGEIFHRKNKTLPLITKERIPNDGIYKYYDVDGYFILSGTDSQHRLLRRMDKDLKLGLTIE